MSGYNKETGIFELTVTKARYWFRRKDVPATLINKCECCNTVLSTEWDIIKSVLEWQGLEIVKDGHSYLMVKATPEQVWEALSGQPSNPDRAEHYYRE